MEYKERYNSWLKDDYFDEDTKNELLEIKNDDKEIQERFYKDLEFGTGGLRGIIGAGTNRINVYTVSKATQGLANYILKQKDKDGKNMGVCIAYDSRRFSPLFAKTAALVLNGNGIKSYIFDALKPTPTLSFAVRELGAIAGIVITASHNPPEYNGYKVYWSDGGQVPYPRDNEIINEVNDITDFKLIKKLDENKAIKDGLYNIIGKEVDDKFIHNVKSQIVNKDIIEKMTADISIVYTPLHGTGNILVRRALKEAGFKNVHVVKEQELPDENFTTVGYPNPEDPKVFKLGIELANQVNADIVIATDPDCDRMGALVKNDKGEYEVLNGNMVGVLMTDYLIKQRKAKGTLPKNPAVISTIVSTNMTKVITDKNNIAYFEFLTGFKYIGEKIKEFEQTGSHEFILGFEESYGALVGTYARDKDAVVSSVIVCEMIAYYKDKGMSLYDGLIDLYEEYGYFKESIESITLEGIDGINDIKNIMLSMRENPPKTINNSNVVSVRDYDSSVETNLLDGEESKLHLPVSNVLYYTLEDGSWFCVRPSGTEPKIKVYFGTVADTMEKTNDKLALITKDVMKLID